ncbi:MAG: sigma-70 family RNA polymerase sigma factor [Bacteroidales bacterium]|nr:sigma-70 family RNA polymerase sigma factor [Bacteroidales bacterium]
MTAKEYNDEVRLWADDAMRFAVRCGGSHADSQDAVQEALVSLWHRHEAVDFANGKRYLMGAVYRSLMSLFRHRRVVRMHAEATQAIADNAVQPDERFDVREAVEYSLGTLPEVQRAILQLRDVEGYSYAEIGEALSIDVDRVQVYLFRARVAMRKQLKSMGYGSN